MNKLTILTVACILLLVSCLYFAAANIQLKKSIKEISNLATEEFKLKLAKERDTIQKALDEKYRADKVSYEAMAKRLELEKKKVKELEEKLKATKK